MKLILTLLTIGMTICVSAQDQYFRVITVKGDVLHVVDDQENVVVPGARIAIEGELVVAENAMIKIISNDTPIKIQTQGNYIVGELYQSTNQKSMSFTSKFWKYLSDGLSNSDSKKDLKAYGEELVAGGIKGYNKITDDDIKILSMVVGKVQSSSIKFEWEGEGKNYTLNIKDRSNTRILSKKVDGFICTIDFLKESIVPGIYSWQVSADNGEKSRLLNFEYIQDKNIEAKLLRIKDYLEGNLEEKLWIKAVVLEMENYYYDSNQLLRKLLERDPSNMFYRKLLALNNIKVGKIEKGLSYMN